MNASKAEPLRQVIGAEQIQKRVKEARPPHLR